MEQTRRAFMTAATGALVVRLLHPAFASAGGKVVTLPKPMMQGGRPLLDCLRERATNRNLGGEDLTLTEISNLLWVAFGINRPDGRHVIPTARNAQKVCVYAVLGDGVWLYHPKNNSIECVLEGDQRKRFDGSALILLYAAPASDMFAGMHVGSMYQNVGLYCASKGFPNCVKYTNHDRLDKEIQLPQGWKVFITQSISAQVQS